MSSEQNEHIETNHAANKAFGAPPAFWLGRSSNLHSELTNSHFIIPISLEPLPGAGRNTLRLGSQGLIQGHLDCHGARLCHIIMDRPHGMDDFVFQDELAQLPMDLPRAALCMARALAYPGLDVNAYLQRIEALAESARQAVPEASTRERALALADFLFNRVGLVGNKTAYWDPRNSFLNEVLDRQLGIPISLASIYLAVAGKMDIPAYGIGLPGHFILGVDHEEGQLLLDPFNGGTVLTIDDCRRLVGETTGYDGPFQESWLSRAAPRDILTRMLNNLRGIYIHQEAWREAVRVVRLLQQLQPDQHTLLRDLGLLHYKLGSLHQAIEYLGTYLQKAPQARDEQAVRRSLKYVARELARLN